MNNLCSPHNVPRASLQNALQQNFLAERMSDLFNGYELLLFKKFQSEPHIWTEWREKLNRVEETDYGVSLVNKAQSVRDQFQISTTQNIKISGRPQAFDVPGSRNTQ